MPYHLKSLPLVPTLLVTCTVLMLLRLGWWQLERAQEKQVRLAQLTERQGQPAYSLQDINRLDVDVRDFPLQVTGTLDVNRPMLWDNRIKDGRVGYEVIAMLQTKDGNLAVNLGWLPADPDRRLLPIIALPDQLRHYRGVVIVPSSNPLIREVAEPFTGWPRRVQQPDLKMMAERWGVSLLPFMMQVFAPQELGLENNWHPVVMPPEKHLAYAAQWFGLAAACMLIYVLVLRKGKGEK